jgi:hypothetical protein
MQVPTHALNFAGLGFRLDAVAGFGVEEPSQEKAGRKRQGVIPGEATEETRLRRVIRAAAIEELRIWSFEQERSENEAPQSSHSLRLS